MVSKLSRMLGLAGLHDFKVGIYYWCVSFVDQCLGQSEIPEEADWHLKPA